MNVIFKILLVIKRGSLFLNYLKFLKSVTLVSEYWNRTIFYIRKFSSVYQHSLSGNAETGNEVA